MKKVICLMHGIFYIKDVSDNKIKHVKFKPSVESNQNLKKINNLNNEKTFNKVKSYKDSICTKCNKKGHMSDYCWSDMKCLYCNEIGHPERWCFNKMCDYCGQRKHLRLECPYLNKDVDNKSNHHNHSNKSNHNNYSNKYNHHNYSNNINHHSLVKDNLHSRCQDYSNNDHYNNDVNTIKHKDETFTHSINLDDNYFNVAKEHEIENTYSNNNILILDEHNPNFVFNKIDEEDIDEYVSKSSKYFFEKT